MTHLAPSTAPTHALLSDGRTVEIRPARPADHTRVRALYDGMSAENLRLRFFGASALPGQQAAERICRPARPGALSLLVSHGERLVGTAEYDTGGQGTSAEIALAVADDFHHCGVGTLLMEHLTHAARAEGISTFTADTLADNRTVLKVFADLGLRCERRFDGAETHCRIDLAPSEEYLGAVDARGRTADLASLRPLLQPASLAVVGAGRSPGSVGRAVLRNLRRSRFPGRLYAVNPHAHSVERTPCYPSVADLPHAPELAVLTVPARAVPDVAVQCGRAGVRALTVLTSGLSANQGATLLAACRRYDMRLVGPNCLGLANTEDDVRMNATFAASPPTTGTTGLAVQSGGVGIALLGGLSRLGIGVSSFVSLGDKYDVSSNDMLQWWESDGRTGLALLHLESFGNPRAFSRTSRRVTRRMPVLTVDAGRSEAGRHAAASHTAAAATPTITRQALFRQAGITATHSLGDLLGTAALLHSQPLPPGTSVAVISNAGGTGVLAADACSEAGLTLPQLPVDVADELRGWLPAGASVANPVDTTASVGEETLARCVRLLAARAEVDTVLAVLVPTETAAATGDDLTRAVTTSAPGGRARPVVAVLPDQAERVRLLPAGDDGTVPAYADPQDAARAVAHAADRARWLARPQGAVPALDGVDSPRARALVDGFLAGHPDGGWLDPRRCAELLDHYGIPRLPESQAGDESAAAEEAALLAAPGERLALKAYGPGLLHKSERGAVRLDLDGPDEVRAAYRDLAAQLGEDMTGALVQPMAHRGVELVAGIVQDQVFGPLVLFGLGGTATEVLADHAARLAPLTDRDARELLATPRCAPLLYGHRGSRAVDLAGLEQLLLRLSQMACDLPELAEADLNPLVARPDGVVAVDSRFRLVRPRTPEQGHGSDPYPRRLR